MRKVMAVFRKEYLERVKKKSFFIGLILMPLFTTAVMILTLL